VPARRHLREMFLFLWVRWRRVRRGSHSRKQQEVKPRAERTLTAHLWTFIANSLLRLFLRHIGKFNKLASVRERDPGVSHTHIIFALLRAVCFLCKHRALSGRFPCPVAFGSHLFDFPCRPALHPHALNAMTMISTAGLPFLLLESICREPFSSSSDYPRFVSAGVRSVVLAHMPLPK